MEATKCLKPSGSGSRIGDRASVQAATRVNAEQASKRTMCRPTRQPFRGRLTRMGEFRARTTPICCTGVVAAACTQGKRTQHGKPLGVVRDDQPDAREGQAGRLGVSRVAYAFLVYMLSPLPRRSGWAYYFAHSPSRISLPRKGCRVGLRIVLFEDCSAFTRVTACTLALSPICDTLIEGFSHFVTSMTAPVASG